MLFFAKIMRRFFFGLDSVLFNFIDVLYDLLMSIAKTSILTQGEIAQFAQRIELLLGIFMLFKLSFSLITYIVNPDDFSDKQKGFGKLIQSAVISLLMLVLVPYIFQMAFNFQTKILEGNVLAKLILGEDEEADGDDNFLNTAGEEMAFSVMLPFFKPNYSINNTGADLSDCISIYESQGQKNVFSAKCKSALSEVGMETTPLENYSAGITERSLGLTFRIEAALSSTGEGDTEEFLIDYMAPISTVVAVVVCLLLVTFCIDIGVRNVKLAFLQLIYPIPVISYMDPKSGKDGLFKKWYQMCFSTFLSLFVRLLALYFGVYIISKVGSLGVYDVVTGSQITNGWVMIFVIIGVLMFVKQLPKILENLGIKLDGDGKFTLNPLKKIEEGAVGGKRITGAAAGFAIGALGNKGNPLRAVGGMFRGAAGNQGLSATAKHQADVNRKLRQAKLDGSTFGGRMNARWTNFSGAKGFDNVEKDRKKIEALNKFAESGSKIENRALDKIKNGEAGDLSREYLSRKSTAESLKNYFNEHGTASYRAADGTVYNGAQAVAQAEMEVNSYLNDTARDEYINRVQAGTHSDPAMQSMFKDYKKYAEDANVKVSITGADIHSQTGKARGKITDLDVKTRSNDTANKANQDYVEAAKWKK